MDVSNPSPPEKSKDAVKMAKVHAMLKRARGETLQSIKMLVLLERPETVDNSLACSEGSNAVTQKTDKNADTQKTDNAEPKKTFVYSYIYSAENSDDDSKDFYQRVNEGSNNIDFLVDKYGNMNIANCKRTLVDFEETKDGKLAKFNGANMMLAFLVAKMLGITAHGLLRFTFIDNFMSILNSPSRSLLASLISNHFNLVVLTPHGEVRKAGREASKQVEKLLQFCAVNLVQTSQVFTYQPISFAWFLESKFKCDQVFQRLKLQFTYLTVRSTLVESGQVAFLQLQWDFPDHEHIVRIGNLEWWQRPPTIIVYLVFTSSNQG
jgi:hypothetical protein